MLNRVEVENTIFTKIGYPLREERELLDSTAMREAIINAAVHNDYSYGATPKLEFFSDRVEITSMGGLPYGVDEEDFFSGFSVPRNKEIMRVFRDLEIVEQLGSGIPRILKAYGKEAFEIRKSLVRVILRFAEPLQNTPSPVVTPVKTPVKTLVKTLVKTPVKTPDLILEILAATPTMTLAEVAVKIDKSLSAVERASAKLVQQGKLLHVGPAKGGHWQVLGVREGR